MLGKHTELMCRLQVQVKNAAGKTQIKKATIEPEVRFWDRLIMLPDNPYKRAFDMLVAVVIVLDIIFSSYKYGTFSLFIASF